MPIAPTSSGGFRFGPFEFDRATGELRKGGTKIRLNGQAVQALTALLENAGHLITREERAVDDTSYNVTWARVAHQPHAPRTSAPPSMVQAVDRPRSASRREMVSEKAVTVIGLEKESAVRRCSRPRTRRRANEPACCGYSQACRP